MSEKDVYIGGTSIQIGEHGFINQPKEIIEHIKYLQKQLQQKENIIKEVREYIKENTKGGTIKDKRYFYSPEQANDILGILDKE